MKFYKDAQIVFILAPFVLSYALGLDIYIPLVPEMTKIFNTTPSLIQLTMSFFLLITGVGQLLIGPIADRVGRKPVFFTSTLLYSLGSLAAIFSPSIDWLIFSRVFAAFGACGMIVTSFALVRDLYTQEKSAKIYSFLNGAVGISPTFAPIIGGQVSYYFGWQSVFLLLFFIGLVGFFVTLLFIKETWSKSCFIPLDLDVLKRYKKVFKNRQLISYSLLAGFADAVLFSFFSVSPFVIIDVHGVPSHHFGFYFAFFGLVIAIGGFLSGVLVEKWGSRFAIKTGIQMMLLGGVLMALWYLVHVSLIGFLLPMMIACMGAMFLIGSSASKALEPFGDMAGTASAAFGSIQFGLSALLGSLLMAIAYPTPFSYAILIILVGVSSLLVITKAIKIDSKVTL